MRRFIVACFLISTHFYLSAQRFAGTPPSVKWKQINTDSARIIFPAGLDSIAQRVAAVIHYQASHISSNMLGDRIKKINVVLQSQTTIPNGYVGLGPYRSEFYLNPQLNNFDLGSISWPDQLAIHEYRHVQQFNNFNNGLSRVMKTLFGEEGYSLAINASIPNWFYEGDAVYNETVLLMQGRGRLPLFMNAYPALWTANKRYSWMKLRNGSLKDYVPDHYNLGYLLVNYGHKKYGDEFWTGVAKDASAFKSLFYPFQTAIKKHAGVDYKTFLRQAFNYYKNLTPTVFTGERVKEINFKGIIPVNKKIVTEYFFPYSISPDSLIYLKTAYNKRPAFFIKDKKGEHRLMATDITLGEQFSYRNGKIVYAAYESDARWSWKDYSVIKLVDIKTGLQRTITHKTKYFTPDISASGNKIVAVGMQGNGKSELHILDAATGETKKIIVSAGVIVFTDPKFINDDTLVAALRLKNGEMALARINSETGSITRITPPSFNVVGFPCVNDNIIYFTASYGGSDNVFAIKPGDTTIYRLTDYPLGNYFVNVANGKMTWSSFTAEGFQLQQMDEKNIEWNPVNSGVIEELIPLYPVNRPDNVAEIIPGNIPERKFSVNKYSQGTGLLNFHSWRPYYEDPVFTFSLYGENVLNTMQTEVYYLYNQNEKTNAAGISATYGQLFPYLSIGTQMTFNRQDSVNNLLRSWNQLDSRIGFTIPLNFTNNQTYKYLNFGTNYFLRNEFNTGPNKNSIATRDFTYLHHFINWSQQIESAVQHIYPHFGNSVSINHRYAITKIKGYQFFASAALYLPGLFSTHNFVLTGSFQQRDTSLALFSSRFANARGYEDYYLTNAGSRMWRLSANYHFPLLMPDWGFGNILYLQRIRANVFYDMQRLFSNNKLNTADLRSFGGELYVDTKWWNQYPLTFGIRVSHLMDNDPRAGLAKGSNVFEFILPVSIIPK